MSFLAHKSKRKRGFLEENRQSDSLAWRAMQEFQSAHAKVISRTMGQRWLENENYKPESDFAPNLTGQFLFPYARSPLSRALEHRPIQSTRPQPQTD